MNLTAIQLTDLSVKRGMRLVLEAINGNFAFGSLTAVIGPNGAGKSTLLKTIMQLLKPVAGCVTSHFTPQQIAYLPQAAAIDRSIPLTVQEVVAMGAWQQIGALKKINTNQRQRISQALNQVNLLEFSQRPVEALSAGQFQRVLFARLLMQDAALILLDEPFTGIDLQTTEMLSQLILQWHQQKRTIIAVLHDLNQVETYFPMTMLLAQRVIAWGPTSEVMTSKNLQNLLVVNDCAVS